MKAKKLFLVGWIRIHLFVLLTHLPLVARSVSTVAALVTDTAQTVALAPPPSQPSSPFHLWMGHQSPVGSRSWGRSRRLWRGSIDPRGGGGEGERWRRKKRKTHSTSGTGPPSSSWEEQHCWVWQCLWATCSYGNASGPSGLTAYRLNCLCTIAKQDFQFKLGGPCIWKYDQNYGLELWVMGPMSNIPHLFSHTVLDKAGKNPGAIVFVQELNIF